MMPRTSRIHLTSLCSLIATCAALSFLGACNKSEEAKPPPHAAAPPAAAPQAAAPQQQAPFRVARIELGNAVGADKKVTAPVSTFKPADTIYASILTEGAASNVALGVRWTFEDGQLVNEATQSIAPTGAAATEFHIAKPDGWPAGKYKVEVSANGKPAGAAQFSVAD